LLFKTSLIVAHPVIAKQTSVQKAKAVAGTFIKASSEWNTCVLLSARWDDAPLGCRRGSVGEAADQHLIIAK
jgi:hypothetical protein